MVAIPTTAAGIADAVRDGSVTASDVVERHLAAIEAREHEIHAFNLVGAEAATGGGGRDRRRGRGR